MVATETLEKDPVELERGPLSTAVDYENGLQSGLQRFREVIVRRTKDQKVRNSGPCRSRTGKSGKLRGREVVA